MRLFIASGIFHPDSGGPATYLYRLLPELQARGHDLRVLANGDGPTAGYPYPLERIPSGPLPLRMARYARAYRRDAAWANLIYLNSLGLPRSGDRHKRRVMKVVGDYAWERSVNRGWISPTEDIDRFQTKRYGPVVEWLKASRSREVQSMDRVIVPSEYLRQMVVGWGAKAERVQVIYNALDSAVYTAPMTRAEARQRLGWRPDGRYVITAARLTAWKGVDSLIDALACIPHIELVVAGDGPQLAALKTHAAQRELAGRVLFLGNVPHAQLSTYFRAADYLALYSGYEGLSHTLLEALYTGTPVIASRKGGNPELIRHEENGLLVDYPSLDALVAALEYAFEDGRQERLAANTSQGLDRFAWPTLVEQTVETLLDVARTPAPR